MARIPSKTEILDWIAENPGLSARRDIARAFGIKGAERIELKRLLKELESGGTFARRKSYRDVDKLPPVSVLTILAPDRDGDQFARAVEWQSEGPEPRILFMPRKAFQYDVFGFAQYLMTDAARGESDSASPFLRLLVNREKRDPTSVLHIYGALEPYIEFVASRQDYFDVSPHIYGNFRDLQQELASLCGR